MKKIFTTLALIAILAATNVTTANASPYIDIYSTASGYPINKQAELEGRILGEMVATGYSYEQMNDEIKNMLMNGRLR